LIYSAHQNDAELLHRYQMIARLLMFQPFRVTQYPPSFCTFQAIADQGRTVLQTVTPRAFKAAIAAHLVQWNQTMERSKPVHDCAHHSGRSASEVQSLWEAYVRDNRSVL